jgi:hypothetical protein
VSAVKKSIRGTSIAIIKEANDLQLVITKVMNNSNNQTLPKSSSNLFIELVSNFTQIK